MNGSPVLMDFASFQEQLGKDFGRAQEIAYRAAEDLTDDEQEQAALVAEFNAALAQLHAEDKGPGILSSAENALAARLQTYFVERAIAERSDAIVPTPDRSAREVKYDNLDVFAWLWVGLKILFRAEPYPWQPPSPTPSELPDVMRVALFSDWGTALYGALKIRETLQKHPDRFDLVMHLGDTYYSGATDEIQRNLVDMWPRQTKAIKRALNGNHEMYSGHRSGQPYFEAAKTYLNQPSSCFAFQNQRWLLVGLDTAYSDHNLHSKQGQVEWLQHLLSNAGHRRVILFSHHQPFSQLDNQGEKLQKALGPLLKKEERIAAWFWGHEHRCVIYDPHPSWCGLKGRCIGHGGFPYFRDKFSTAGTDTYLWRILPRRGHVPGAAVLDGPNFFIEGHETRFGPHGYVELTFNGSECREVYLTANGLALREPALL